MYQNGNSVSLYLFISSNNLLEKCLSGINHFSNYFHIRLKRNEKKPTILYILALFSVRIKTYCFSLITFSNTLDLKNGSSLDLPSNTL